MNVSTRTRTSIARCKQFFDTRLGRSLASCGVLVLAFVMVTTLYQPVLQVAHAVVGPNGTFLIYNSGDPCSNPNVPKSFAVVSISTATTTELVAAVAGQVVYVCALPSTVVGTSPTILFKTGTKVSTACDTGPTSQSGTYAVTSGNFFKLDANGGTVLTGAVGGELCLTSGGTSPSIQGNLIYVQQ